MTPRQACNVAYAALRDQIHAAALGSETGPAKAVAEFDADLAKPLFAHEVAAERALLRDVKGVG